MKSQGLEEGLRGKKWTIEYGGRRKPKDLLGFLRGKYDKVKGRVSEILKSNSC